MRALGLVLLLLIASLPARAGEIIGALSQNRVDLTATFSGSEILIFGAVRHAPEDMIDGQPRPFDVVITVEGPRQTVYVFRKDRVAGIWMNTDQVRMESVPSFYAVATTGPLETILSPETDAEYRISTHATIGGATEGVQPLFAEALTRIRERGGSYLALNRYVHMDREVLFRTVVRLPANLTEGAYTTRMYLVRDGAVISQYRTAIFVRKDGLERWLHQMAYDQPLLYGVMALLMALAAGWGASALVAAIRDR
jgi:uncharacterized protein (TIGR02186 family)